jgi:hypothetical protein
MSEIPVDTSRYERKHGRKPVGRRYWSFTLVSSSITAKDHPLLLQDEMTYQKALERAQEVAARRKSERIIVEP